MEPHDPVGAPRNASKPRVYQQKTKKKPAFSFKPGVKEVKTLRSQFPSLFCFFSFILFFFGKRVGK